MSYSNKKTIKDINVSGKRVLVRCDFNVPLDQNNKISDTKRITASLKTIKYLISKKARIILCSHLGRPKGNYSDKFSLNPVAEYLSKIINSPVIFTRDVVGRHAQECIESMKEGEIVLLENLRFHKEETQNNSDFAKKLSSFADIFINDAFGTCHRSHASTVGITKYLPSAYGFLIENELSIMNKTLKNPQRPFVAILGGAKVSDKIKVISKLLEKVNILIIGGGMSYTFTNALGYSVGTSLYEPDKVDSVRDMMVKAKENDVKILLPIDIIVGKSFSAETESQIVDADRIPPDWMGLDIGPRTTVAFSNAIKEAKTVIWNGPLGVFEWENFSHGTKTIAETVAKSHATTIIGGGDSAAAVEKFKLSDQMTHVSTGGGASLCLLEGEPLPGLDALDDK